MKSIRTTKERETQSRRDRVTEMERTLTCNTANCSEERER